MAKKTLEVVEANGSDYSDGFVKPLDKGYKDLGFITAVGLMVNRMLGTGIFATPATIYILAGRSVGLALILWVIGALIALSGLFVYLEFGTSIPRNGGEKNYLEYVYSKPKFLVTSLYASYAFFLGWPAGNAIVSAQYFFIAADKEPTKWQERGLAVGIVVFCVLVHGLHIKTGAYLQNLLGAFKIGVVLFITVTGWVSLGGWKKTDNFQDTFKTVDTASAYGIVNALYNVIWSYIGYSNANYALGEIKNPVKTLKYAGPAALIVLAIIYLFVNIAYFAIVPKDILETSSTILAADFFGIAFGHNSRKAASVFVALSALGNVLSVIFSQGRIINQLGREGVLPFSKFFATSRPFNTPLVGLAQHGVITIITILATINSSDAYNFILNLISYPLNVVNFTVGVGLIYLNVQKHRGLLKWDAPIKATIPVTLFFTLSMLYLIVAPYIPPTGDQSVYENLPYYLHCVVTWGIFGAGLFYWIIWVHVLPAIFHYTIHAQEVVGEDGFWRNDFKKVKNDEYDQFVTEQADRTKANDQNESSISIEHEKSNI